LVGCNSYRPPLNRIQFGAYKMSGPFTFDVFLSHNSKDKLRVRALAGKLKAAGLSVWFDEWIIKPGDDIYLKIENGLATSRVLVLCMSPNAFASDWVGLERSTVLFRDPSNAGRRFVPLLLEDCTPPETLRRYKYLDYRAVSKVAFRDLLIACGSSNEISHTRKRAIDASRRPRVARRIETANNQIEVQLDLPGEGQPVNPDNIAIEEGVFTLDSSFIGWIERIAVSSDESWCVVASSDGGLYICDIIVDQQRHALRNRTVPKGRPEKINDVLITADDSLIVSGADGGSIRVWSVASGKELSCLALDEDVAVTSVLSVTSLPGGTRVIAAGAGYDIKIWDINTKECLKVVQYSTSIIYSIALLDGGTRALVGGGDGILRLLEVDTGKLISEMTGHSGVIRSIKITPDARLAASCSDDYTIKLWNLETKTCVGTLEGHTQPVVEIAISQDGKLIASVGFTDDTCRIWELRTGACLGTIDARTRSLRSIKFINGASRLLIGTTGREIILYKLKDLLRPKESIRRYINAKIVLLGESGVGKTTLAHRLVEDRFVKTESTHGMNVWRLDLPFDGEGNLNARRCSGIWPGRRTIDLSINYTSGKQRSPCCW
jgi:hypothetical protein